MTPGSHIIEPDNALIVVGLKFKNADIKRGVRRL
jgi:hypothetical protein